MFKIVTAAAGIAALLILAGCSIAPPSGSAARGELDAAAADSLNSTPYDEMFLDLYGEITRKLDVYAENDRENIVLIEVQSVVTIAEEMYLEGNVELAVILLREAALLLRQTP